MTLINFFKKHWTWFVLICLMVIAVLAFNNARKNGLKLKEKIDEIEFINKQHQYRKLYYEKEINSLKKDNRELYDSIKDYKNQVSWLVQFKYEKEYDTGVVNVKPKADDSLSSAPKPEVKEYTYKSELNDTMNYNLTVGSEKELAWYRLKVTLSDKFTIINRENGELNDVTIGGEHQGNITDVTVFTKKKKQSIFSRFAIGPSIGYSYDFKSKSFGPTLSISLTYNLAKTKE